MVTKADETRLAAELAAAQATPEPDIIKPGDRVTPVRPDGGEAEVGRGLPSSVLEVSGPRRTPVWHTETYEVSIVNANMLPQQLMKMIPGTDRPAFSTTQPRDENGQLLYPVRGSRLCLLHPSSPDREMYDDWGLVRCEKSNLRSQMDVVTHMQRTHQREHAAIQLHSQDIEKLEAKEDRAVMRQLLERTVPQAVPAPVVAPSPPEAAVQAEPQVAVRCAECDHIVIKPTQRGAASSMRAHMKKKHKGG